MLLHGRPPSALGYPSWRTRVAYVPQSRPSTLSGTPAELYAVAQQLGAQRQRPRGDLPSLVHEMGLEQRVLQQQWGELSVSGVCHSAQLCCICNGPAWSAPAQRFGSETHVSAP